MVVDFLENLIFEGFKNFVSAVNSSVDVLGVCKMFLSMESCLLSYIFPGYQMISKVRNRVGQRFVFFAEKWNKIWKEG